MKKFLHELFTSRIGMHLLLVTVLPLLLMVIILSFYNVTSSLNMIEAQLRLRGDIVARTAASRLELSVFADDRLEQSHIAEQLLLLPDIDFVRITDNRDNVLVHKQDHLEERFIPGQEDYWYADKHWYFRAPVYLHRVDYFDAMTGMDLSTEKSGEPELDLVGWVVIGISDDAATRQTNAVFFNSMVISIGGFFAAILLWMGISNRLSLTLDNLMRTIRRLQTGDLEARAFTMSDGELKELINGFNQLADQIQISNKEMSAKVRHATKELNETMKTLRVQNLALEKTRAEAEAANEAKDLFLARMSHELRTPLTSIIGFARLVEDLPEGQQREEAVSVIQTASRLLLTAIDDILSYVKIQSGSLMMEAIPFNLVTCVEEVVTMLKDAAHEKNIILEFIIDADVPPLYLGDQTRVAQVLTNLLSNAIKFTEVGSVSLHLEVAGIDEQELMLRFRITDTGIGISPIAQSRLFQPFVQADSTISRRFGGSGLGLQISKQIIEMMNGTIRIDSKLNVGTTVTFTLQLETVTGKTRSLQKPLLEHVLLFGQPSLSRQALESLLSPLSETMALVDSEDHLQTQLQAGTDAELIILVLEASKPDEAELTGQLSRIRALSSLPILITSQFDIGLNSTMSREFHPLYFLQSPISHQTLLGTLPVIRKGQDLPEARSRQTQTGSRAQRVRRVLLVEDHPLNRKFLNQLLACHGVQTSSAEDGYEALKRLEDEAFDLVLMDLHLPEMDGRECTRRLRAGSSINASVPVYALTAELGAESDTSLFKDGFNGVMLKPVDEVLLDAVLNLGGEGGIGNMESIARGMKQQTFEELRSMYQRLINDIEQNQWLSARATVHQMVGLVGINQIKSLQSLVKQLQQACHDRDSELAMVLLDEYIDILNNS